MIQWPFTDTMMSGNRNFISEEVFSRFGVYWILCGTELFVYFYWCLISMMTGHQEYCEKGSVVYDTKEKAHFRNTDEVEKVLCPWTILIVQQTFPPWSATVCLSLPKTGSPACHLLSTAASPPLSFCSHQTSHECSCNGTMMIVSSVLTTFCSFPWDQNWHR